MEISQKKYSSRTRYVFGEEKLDYTLEDGSGRRSFSVAYSEISGDRQVLEERNLWLRNVGLLWIVLGAVMTLMTLLGDKPFRISIWLWIGAGCYAAYSWRSTVYIILPTERGNLLVIDDDQGQQILQQISERRTAYLRSAFDFMSAEEHPDQSRRRYRWLHSEGALSDDELAQRLAMVDASEAAVLTHDDQRPRLLN